MELKIRHAARRDRLRAKCVNPQEIELKRVMRASEDTGGMMQVCMDSALPAPATATSRPLVTLLVEYGDSSDCRRLVSELDAAFTCQIQCHGSDLSSNAGCDTELVVWLCTPAAAPHKGATALVQFSPTCPVIAIVDDLTAIMTLGPNGRPIADFIVRPYSPHELVLRARRVLGLMDPRGPTDFRPPSSNVKACVVGRSAAITRELDKLKRFSACDAGVLILGETGTGKEVFAQATHYLSARASRPMVAINCGAVPAELLEAELFGHVKGAYTNAHMSRTGLVTEAQRGTLFLDDVDCLPLPAQAKLLRFLQEREYRVVGSNVIQHADVRVIAASNRDLATLAKQGGFRQDLFYRLNVLTLSLPPLREHKDDIAELAQHFLRQFAQRHRRPVYQLSPAAMLKLLAYDWPGNVRELGHVLERAFLLCAGLCLQEVDIDLPRTAEAPPPTAAFQAMKARVVQSFEKSYIENILSSTRGNVTEAARVAGKNRRALFELIRKHEIKPDSFRNRCSTAAGDAVLDQSLQS